VNIDSKGGGKGRGKGWVWEKTLERDKKEISLGK